MSRKNLPEAVAAAIDRLQGPDGTLRPADVVQAAANNRSPLHRYFTWDDREAAEAHRLQQAEDLIRRVRVEVVIEERHIAAPAYVHDPSSNREMRYIFTPTLRQDPELARRALGNELRSIAGWLERAERLAEVFELGSHLTEATQRVRMVQTMLEPAEAA